MKENVIFDRDRRNRIRILGEGIFRISHLRQNGSEFVLPDPAWYPDIVQEMGDYSPSEYTFTFSNGLVSIADSKDRVCFSEKSFIYRERKASLVIHKDNNERLFGGGEWFNHFGVNKGRFRLSNNESPEFLQFRQTYSNLPIYISSARYLFFLLNSHPMFWRIKEGEICIDVDGGNLDYLVILGDDPKMIIEKYTKLTGRPRLVPKWAFGLWATSYPQDTQFKVSQFARAHREQQIPLDVIILDYHWEDRFHNFNWRKKLFPAPETLIADLREMGIKVGLIFTPFINIKNDFIKKRILNLILRNVPKGCETDDESDISGYQEGRDGGYFAHDLAVWWFGKGGMLDFTNSQAVRWWNQKLEPLYRSGIALFKNDDGEYLPENAHSHYGMDAKEYHNIYGFYYGKAIYEGMEKLDQRRAIIFSRSVWCGSQRYPGMFLGDQHPTFNNIKKTIRAGLNMSLLGFSYWGADIFGLDGKTSPETHMRYAQWAIFSPIARYFYRPAYIENSRQPWLQSGMVENNFRDLVNLRYRLLPYYYSAAWTAYKEGTPIIRPLFLEFPEDETTWKIDDQVMIGDTLMLAPVVKSGKTSRNVYFPEGEWFDIVDDSCFQGNQWAIIEIPVNKVALFARSGGVLAFGPTMSSISEKHAFNQLEIHFWGQKEAQFNLYDDDGLTRNYLSGDYLKTKIHLSQVGGGILIGVKPEPKGYLPDFFKRVFNFVVHRCFKPTHIILNGGKTLKFIFDENKNDLHFVIEADITREYEIFIK